MRENISTIFGTPERERHYLSDYWKSVCENISTIFDTPQRERHLICPYRKWVLISISDMYVRECYTQTVEVFRQLRQEAPPNDPALLLLTGTSGVGKSGLLEYLLLCLVKEANNKGEIWRIRLTKLQSEKTPAESVVFSTDGNVHVDDNGLVDFLLSDSVDISDLNKQKVRWGCVLATSEKSTESKHFEKSTGVATCCVPVWSLEELREISPFSAAETEIRYAVFGGSARHFLGFEPRPLPSVSPYSYVAETVEWFFDEEKQANALTELQWNKIVGYLVRRISSSANKEHDATCIAVKGLMWHTNDNLVFFFASQFMSLLAQHILTQQETNLKEALKKVIGASGVGCTYEYLGNKQLLARRQSFRLIPLNRNSKPLQWTVPNLKLQKFRTIEDIGRLSVGSYGMPISSQFALIDAVVQPDKLLNYTIASRHKGGDAIRELRAQLQETDPTKHKFIWMVPTPGDFKAQRDLGDIAQYAMSYEMWVERSRKK